MHQISMTLNVTVNVICCQRSFVAVFHASSVVGKCAESFATMLVLFLRVCRVAFDGFNFGDLGHLSYQSFISVAFLDHLHNVFMFIHSLLNSFIHSNAVMFNLACCLM